jgi:transposase
MNEETGLEMPSAASAEAETGVTKGVSSQLAARDGAAECLQEDSGGPGFRAESGSGMLSAAPGGALEGEVIDQQLWGAIAALRERGLAKKAIARKLGLDIKTVRKWWSRTWKAQERQLRGRLLDRWTAFLRARAPEVGFNSVVLCRELTELGERCCVSTVAKYIAPWRAALRKVEPTIRFETGPGEQGQVDWGSTWIYLGLERVRVHLFTMVLGFSRRLFAKAYSNEGLESLLEAHAAAFEHFGGRPESLLYDNPRTIVIAKDESTGQVSWNAAFKDRMDFYGLKIRLCRYYRAQTKGKVESGVKYVKRNALAGRRFVSLEELNAYLLGWCVEVADQRVHGTTHEKPADRFARAEQLIPVDQRPPTPRERVETRQLSRDGYVAVDANLYPVPLEWVEAVNVVEVRILAEEIWIHRPGVDPVHHARLTGKHQVARWEGPARQVPRRPSEPGAGPPRFDPAYVERIGEVEVRPLGRYEGLLEEAHS